MVIDLLRGRNGLLRGKMGGRYDYDILYICIKSLNNKCLIFLKIIYNGVFNSIERVL